MTKLFKCMALPLKKLHQWYYRWFCEPYGSDRSLNYNMIHGKYRVRYNSDGAITQPFCIDVAKDYAEIFGGTVIDKDTHEPVEV